MPLYKASVPRYCLHFMPLFGIISTISKRSKEVCGHGCNRY